MADDVLEKRLESLTAELKALKKQVSFLTSHLGLEAEPLEQPSSAAVAVESGGRQVLQAVPETADATAGIRESVHPAPPTSATAPSAVFPETAGKKIKPLPAEPSEVTEELLTWAGKASLLPRLATLCFLLVVALVLRTITDNKMIDTLIGSGLGMGYAAALMIAGWVLYRKESPLAPVFSATGAILIGTIVVETHARFQSLPLVPAYLTLMATGAWMTFTSYRHNAFVPISCGTLSMCLAGAAIDYPHPYFPYLSMILLTANVLGFFAARLQRCSWLRWTVLVVTLVMLQLWSVRLGTVLGKSGVPLPELATAWFFPVAGLFAVTFFGLALAGIIKSGAEQIARFDYLLPTVSAAWIFAAAHYVVSAGGGSKVALGGVGIAAAVAHLGIGFWLGSRSLERAPGTNAYIAAGSVLLAYALQVTLPNPLLALPFIGGAAIGLVILGHRWKSGGVRFTSYLLQIYAGALAAIILYASTPARDPAVGAVIAGLMAAIGLGHYLVCRRIAPPDSSRFFSRYDHADRSAALLLLVSLASGFFMLRIGVYHLLPGLPAEVANSFRCSQSIIVNCAAIGLMVVATLRNNREIRNVAVLVTVIGAGMVVFDFMGAKGMPLVLSVLSFGVAAAVESIILGRWQRLAPRTPAGDEGPAA